MKALGCCLMALLVLSFVGTGVVLYDKGSLASLGGIIMWLVVSTLTFVVFAVCLSPILLIVGLIGRLFGK